MPKMILMRRAWRAAYSIVQRWKTRAAFRGSASYWQQRYAAGGNSGPGSRGEVAAFKAEILNALCSEHDVRDVIELGCGDGYQLTLTRYPRYIGMDVSKASVHRCIDLFKDDPTKSFFWYDPQAFVNNGALVADLAISLDVILHLVEEPVFDRYMRHLFGCAERLVCVFSSNYDDGTGAAHVRHRAFTKWVEANAPEWILHETVANPWKGPDSAADFYIYKRSSLSS